VIVELANILQVLLNSVPLIAYRDTVSPPSVKADLYGDIIYRNAKYEEFNQYFNGEIDHSKQRGPSGKAGLSLTMPTGSPGADATPSALGLTDFAGTPIQVANNTS
jgi:hypothetical protein